MITKKVKNSTFGEKLIRYRLEHGKMSQEELAAIVGTTKQVISRYEKGQRTPKIDLVQIYAEKLGLPVLYLVDDKISIIPATDTTVLTEHEGEVIVAYRDKPAIQPAVDKLLDVEPETNVVPFAEPSNIKTVPLSFGKKIAVLGRVPAGTPIEAVEDIVGEIYLDEKYNDGHEYFALKVNGHSMEPEYNDGDYVIVRKQETAENGDDVIAYVNGYEATLKRFYKDENGITLQALNPDYETRSFTPDQVNELPISLAGIVTELVRRPQAKKNVARNGRNNKIPPVNAKDIKEQPPFEDK
jgi:repressor LexA